MIVLMIDDSMIWIACTGSEIWVCSFLFEYLDYLGKGEPDLF